MLSPGPKIISALILVVTIAVGALGWSAMRKAMPQQADGAQQQNTHVGIAVRAADAETRTIPFQVRGQGFLEPYESLTVFAEVSAYIAAQLVEVSDSVEFDAPLFQFQRDLFEVAVDKAQAVERRMESDLTFARHNRQRVGELEQSESANPTEVLQAETELKKTEAALNEAKAAVTEADFMLQKTIVRSPIDGVVARLYKRRGEYAHTGEPLVDLVELDRLKLIVQLEDRQVVHFQIGDPVSVQAVALPRKTFQGQVLRIHPVAELDSRKFEVEIEVANPDRLLRPGFYAEAVLSKRSDTDASQRAVLTIPRLAVLESFRRQYVFVVAGSDDDPTLRAHRVGVETAPIPSDPQSVEVLRGLRPGDRVITKGLQHVTDDTVVRIEP